MADILQEIIETLSELCEDPTIPRNVKAKFSEISSALKDTREISIKVNKALSDLDEIGGDANLQPYTRTQIWSIVSMLEKV